MIHHRPPTPPPFLSLEPILRCANRRCRKVASRAVLQEGALECEHCGAHWWAFRLAAGDVRVQLMRDFENDTETVDGMIAIFELPATLAQPMYWQLLLTGNHWHHYVTDRGADFRTRSLGLLRKIFRLHRVAS